MSEEPNCNLYTDEYQLNELKKKYLDSPSKKPRGPKDSTFRDTLSSNLQSTTSKNTQDLPEKLRQKIEEEKAKSARLDEQIVEKQREIVQLRVKMGGINSTAEKEKEFSKKIKNYENSLEKTIQKYNQTVAHNKNLRFEIEKLRKDKNIYEATFKKLQEDLNSKRNEMNEAIRSAESAYESRKTALTHLEGLKQQNEEEQKQYEREWNELITNIEHDKKRKDFIQQKEKEKLLESNVTEINPEDELKIKNLTKLSEAEKQATNESAQLVRNYEEALAKIKAETGVESLQDLVDAFTEYEKKNSALLNFVNELSKEIEDLEKNIEEIKAEINKYKQMGALTDTSKKKMLQKMEEKLANMEFRNSINDLRLKESMKTIAFIKEQLKGFLQALDPEDPLIAEMDDQALTEANMMKYLAEIEVKANKIIQNYALVQAQKLQVEAIIKDDPNLHKDNIAALNNVMALGSQTVPSNGQISVTLPGVEEDEDDEAAQPPDHAPMDIEDFRLEAERQMQQLRYGRGTTLKHPKTNAQKRGNKK